MKKYYDNLDDYYDTSRSPILDIVERIVPCLIFLGAVVVILGVCGHLEAL